MSIKKRINVENGVDVLIWTDKIDDRSTQQLINVAKLPFVFKHIAAMPDVHAGMGATIGSVIATKGAIIPAAVGVDIGCGMIACQTNLSTDVIKERELPLALQSITRRTPVGQRWHKEKNIHWEAVEKLKPSMEEILAAEPTILNGLKRVTWESELATLGSGNHFIELQRDTEGRIWIMIHTGSRGVGNVMANFFIKRAKAEMAADHIALSDDNLAYLEEGTDTFNLYMKCLEFSQRYALSNREEILTDVLKSLKSVWPDVALVSNPINVHHNYVAKETHFGEVVWVTRKGASRAGKDEWGIIPGSMGTKSYIVQGLGNPDSFESSSHGAGRKMSRTAARSTFTTEDLHQQTQGVFCRKDTGVLDEIPGAYKNIEDVMEQQNDLVKPVVELKQILCVKG